MLASIENYLDNIKIIKGLLITMQLKRILTEMLIFLLAELIDYLDVTFSIIRGLKLAEIAFVHLIFSYFYSVDSSEF